jgi:acyl-CoA reductase-like NAD-dependent aldehyde dehydrogenase
VQAAEGGSRRSADAQVEASIDRWVWYAGWADKLAQVIGAANPVAGPYFDFSLPEPTGVIGVVAPPESSLLGLVSVLAPVIVTGNTAVVLASADRPLPALALAEVLATSDLPGGVVNLLTGPVPELVPWLAEHTGVDGLDLTGVTEPELAVEAERRAAVHLKRLRRAADAEAEWADEPALTRMTAFTETKTVWHPIGL